METRLLCRSPPGVFQMLGPLPVLHRFVMVLAALAVCVGIGAWLGFEPEFALNIRAGLVSGSGAGLAAVFLLLHDFHPREHRVVSVRRRMF